MHTACPELIEGLATLAKHGNLLYARCRRLFGFDPLNAKNKI